jgi:hypothetical protein
LCAVWLAALLTGSLVQAQGQDVPSASPQTVVDVLHLLSDKSDLIFCGQVVAILRDVTG